jgi:hypothetical protein
MSFPILAGPRGLRGGRLTPAYESGKISGIIASDLVFGSLHGYATVAESPDTGSAFGGVSVLADVGATEGQDTLTSDSVLAYSGIGATFSTSEAADTGLGSAVLGLTGTLSSGEASDSLASLSAVGISGTDVTTESDDTVSATSGVSIHSQLSVTEAPDGWSSFGQLTVNGAASPSEQDDGITSAAGLALAANLGSPESDDLLAASCSIVTRGSLEVGEGDDTVASESGVADVTRFLRGVSRDSVGAVLPSATVKAFRTVDDVKVDQAVSGLDGGFVLSVVNLWEHYLVCYKAGSPDIFGTSVNTLVGDDD